MQTPPTKNAQREDRIRVVITEIDMPMRLISAFFLRCVIAAIPAIIMIGLIVLALFTVLAGLSSILRGR
jgi:hypothetical protein